jgi:hypothetical protein
MAFSEVSVVISPPIAEAWNYVPLSACSASRLCKPIAALDLTDKIATAQIEFLGSEALARR